MAAATKSTSFPFPCRAHTRRNPQPAFCAAAAKRRSDRQAPLPRVYLDTRRPEYNTFTRREEKLRHGARGAAFCARAALPGKRIRKHAHKGSVHRQILPSWHAAHVVLFLSYAFSISATRACAQKRRPVLTFCDRRLLIRKRPVWEEGFTCDAFSSLYHMELRADTTHCLHARRRFPLPPLVCSWTPPLCISSKRRLQTGLLPTHNP